MVADAPLQVIGGEGERTPLAEAGKTDGHDTVRLRIRQGLEQDRVDDAEDGSRRADAEREYEGHQEREPGRPSQGS